MKPEVGSKRSMPSEFKDVQTDGNRRQEWRWVGGVGVLWTQEKAGGPRAGWLGRMEVAGISLQRGLGPLDGTAGRL